MKGFSGLTPIIIIVIISIVSKLLKAKKKSETANKTIYFDKKGNPINQNNQNTKKKGLFSYIETLKQEMLKQQEGPKKSYQKENNYQNSLKNTQYNEKKYEEKVNITKRNEPSRESNNLKWKDNDQDKIKEVPNKLIKNREDLKKAIIFSEILNAKYVN